MSQSSLDIMETKSRFEEMGVKLDVSKAGHETEKGRDFKVCPKCKARVLWLVRTDQGYLCEDCLDELEGF